MRERVYILCIVFTFAYGLSKAQPAIGRSNTVFLDFGMPEIVLDEQPSFNDANNNNTLDVGEVSQIAFWIHNEGRYVANNVLVRAHLEEDIEGFLLPTPKNIGNIAPGGKKYVKMLIRGDSTLRAGTARLVFEIVENNDQVSKILYALNTAEVARKAQLRLTSHIFFSDENRIELEKPFTLRVDVQNLGNASAQEVSFDCDVPKQVIISPRLEERTISQLRPGEMREVQFEFLAGINYSKATIPIRLVVKDKHGESRDVINVDAKIIKKNIP